jgi:hypothetical protein
MTQTASEDSERNIKTSEGGLMLPLSTFASDRNRGFLFLTVQESLAHLGAIARVTLSLYLPIALVKNVVIYTLGYQNDPFAALRIDSLLMLLDCLLAPAVIYAILYRLQYNVAPPLKQSLGWGLKKWGKTLYFRVLSTLLVALGLFLLVIPGLVLGVWFALVDAIIAVEVSSQKKCSSAVESSLAAIDGRFLDLAAWLWLWC